MTATPAPATTAPPSSLQSARFYITFRCNSLCGYCNVWQDDKFKGYDELTPDRARDILDQLHQLGVRYVDFTGGEPVLHPHIDEIVQYAKSLGMAVEITSNGIRFAKHIDAIVPYVDTMNVSLDTLRPDRYRAIRGVPTLDRALDVIQRVAATNAGNLKLICVVTRENVDELADLLRFAQDNRVTIYFSTMFEYFDAQDTVRDTNRTARKLKLIEQNGKPLAAGPAPRAVPVPAAAGAGAAATGPESITAELMRLLYQPFTVINLHFRKYMEALDPLAPTDCYANKRILTVGPDGRLVLPCYHAFDNSLAWDRSLVELVQDEEFRRVRDEEVGHRTECRSCTVFPYIGLSFSYRFDKIFLYQALSEEISKIKTRFVDPLSPGRAPASDGLLRGFDDLERFIDRELPDPRPPASFDLFYRFDVTPSGISSELVAGELSLAELLGDHTGEYCWGIQRSPHTWMRLVYRDLVPLLGDLTEQGLLPRDAYEQTVAQLYAVHLAWWQAYLGLYFRGGRALDTTASITLLAGFLERTAALLPDAPQSLRIRQILLHAGCVLGLRPDVLAPLAVGVPFPEATLTAKHLLLVASDDALPRYAALLPAEAADPLLRATRPPQPVPGPAPRDQADLTAGLDDSTPTGLDAETEVARLLAHEDTLDQATAERLATSLGATPEQRRAELARLLLAHELRDPHAIRRRGAALRHHDETRPRSACAH